MMARPAVLFLVWALFGWAPCAHGDTPDVGTAAEAEAMINRAVAYFDAHGSQKAFDAFTDRDGSFVDRDLYIFVVDHDGLTLAHGGNERLVGRNMKELRDADGKLFIQEMIETAKRGGGWVDYKWTNPETKRIQGKTTLVRPLRATPAFAGCGIYK